MSVAFPALVPSGREFVCPKFRVSVGKLPDFGSGLFESPREVGNKGYDSRLSLTFQTRTGAETAEVLSAYRASISGLLPLSLPEEIVGGIDDPTLASKMREAEHLEWKFAGPPRVEGVLPTGISNLRVELIAKMP
jgi:hypothetical protein